MIGYLGVVVYFFVVLVQENINIEMIVMLEIKISCVVFQDWGVDVLKVVYSVFNLVGMKIVIVLVQILFFKYFLKD